MRQTKRERDRRLLGMRKPVVLDSLARFERCCVVDCIGLTALSLAENLAGLKGAQNNGYTISLTSRARASQGQWLGARELHVRLRNQRWPMRRVIVSASSGRIAPPQKASRVSNGSMRHTLAPRSTSSLKTRLSTFPPDDDTTARAATVIFRFGAHSLQIQLLRVCVL